jgi:hypothetical protein
LQLQQRRLENTTILASVHSAAVDSSQKNWRQSEVQGQPHPLSFLIPPTRGCVISRVGILVAVMLSIPIVAHAHAEIFFPKVFSPAELHTSGFVLLNPDPFAANVYVYFVSMDGSVLASKTFEIPSAGQAARLGSELFPDVTSSGWVYVLTDTEGMQAFWLAFNNELTFLDGAEADGYDTIGADQVIPLIAAQTELNIINPNYLTLNVTIQLFGSNGTLGPAVSRTLSPAGAFQAQVATLFPLIDMTAARYLRIKTAAAIATSAMIRGYMVESDAAVVNGINVDSRNQLTFPHVINGILGETRFATVLGITNTSTGSQTVTINFNSDSGKSFSVTRPLAAGGSLRETAAELFGLPPDFQSGWVQVSGTSSIIGFAGYADTTSGGLAVVPSGRAEPRIFFSHIADGAPWGTGIALLNPNSVPAHVEVYAMNPDGSLIGGASTIDTARLTLEPGSKVAKVIDELIPQTRGVNAGFVFVTSDQPLVGLELFYTRDLKILSNVAAARLVPGVAYRPPSP